MKKLVQLKNKENENLDPINLNYEKRLLKLENNAYSTEEQVVGTWVDGKPVYRKVFVLTDASYFVSNSYYDISSLNIEQIFFETRVLNYTDSIGQKYTRAQDEMVSSNDYSRCFFRNDAIQLRLGEVEVNAISNGSNASWIIVINYTKTTDKIIGYK